MNRFAPWLQEAFGFRKLHGYPGVTVVAVETDTFHVFILSREKNGVKLEKSVAIPRSGLTPSSFAELLREQGISGQDVLLCLPQHLSITKRLKVPSSNPSEITQMVNLQACRQMPVDPQEILADYDLVNEQRDGFSEVLITILRKEEIEFVLPFLNAAGLVPGRVVTTSQSVARFIREAKPTLSQALFLYSHGPSVTMGLLQAGRLWAARGLAGKYGGETGSGSLTSDRLVKECLQFLDAFRKDFVEWRPSRVLLLGEWGSSSSLAGLLETALQSPVECLLHPALSICATGAALAGSEEGSNLLPPNEKGRLRHRSMKRQLIACVGLVGLGLGTLGGYAAQRIHRVQSDIHTLDRQLAALSPQVEDLRRKQNHIKNMRQQTGAGGAVLEVLQSLQKRVPSRVSLTSLIYDRDSVSLQGTTFSLSDVVSMVNALEKTEIFNLVELRSSNSRQWRGKDVVDFQVYCGLADQKGQKG